MADSQTTNRRLRGARTFRSSREPKRRLHHDLSKNFLVVALHEALKDNAPINMLRSVCWYVAEKDKERKDQ